MAGAAADQGTSRLAIRADRAFDGREMIPGGALVLCAGGQIAGIEPGTAPAPDSWPAAEFPGATVLPGMIDVTSTCAGIPATAPWTAWQAIATTNSARSSGQPCARSSEPVSPPCGTWVTAAGLCWTDVSGPPRPRPAYPARVL